MTAIEIIRANPGLTAPELAAKYRCGPNRFYHAAERHALPLPKVDRETNTEHARAAIRKRLNTDNNEQGVRNLFGTMSTAAIAAKLGISRKGVNNIVRRLGLKMTDEQHEQWRKDRNAAVGEGRRRANAIRRQRQLSGEEPTTRYLNVFASTTIHTMRKRFVHRYGYVYLDGDYLNLGYDSNTDRCTEAHHSGGPCRKPEEHYTKKYGIQFFNLDDDE